MEERESLRQAWETVHQAAASGGEPLDEVVDFIQSMRGRLRSGAAVLDAGCGKGRNSLYLAQQGFSLWGFDWSAHATALARQRVAQAGLRASIQTADLTRLPYASGCFDGVACVHVLPCNYRDDLFRGVEELRRVLRPGGWLCLDLLHIDDSAYSSGPQVEENTYLDEDGTPLHYSPRAEVDELLRGLRVQRLERLEIGSRPRIAWIAWAQR